jgi:glycosyltransferase involved in cell wall biosynthesis
MPIVSVIIPNYNHAAFLKQRIESVLNQTFQDFELILLDDNSTDNSRDIIDSYKENIKISYILFNKVNSGSTFKQWQKGIDLAKGEYIWIAESDDYADNKFIETLLPIMLSNEFVALAYCQSFDSDEKGEITASRLDWTNDFENNIWKNSFNIKGTDFMNYLFRKNVIPNVSACIIKKDLLFNIFTRSKDLGDYKMGGDWLIWLMIADIKNVQIVFINKHLNYHRFTTTSTTNHNTKGKVLNRIIEEARIFNSGKFTIDQKILKQKNEELKIKWFKVFKKYKFSGVFFNICSVLSVNKLSFLFDYIQLRKGL